MAWPTKEQVAEARARKAAQAEAESSPIPEPQPAMPAALGRLAEAIVGNQATLHAFKDAENEIIARWAATKSAEREEREDHYRALKALQALWDKISGIRNRGQIADLKDRKLRSA